MESFESKKAAPEQKHTEEVYNAYILQTMPKTKTFSGCVKAFLVGGLICAIGQAFIQWGLSMQMDDLAARGFASICLVIIGATLTGIGVFDVIGKFAGAGSVVPITGFANSIVAPAMEHKREGIVLGIGANMFKIAGPVLVYGITASVIYGLIYFLFFV